MPVDEHVARLDVAVRDAAGMQVVQGLGDLLELLQQAFDAAPGGVGRAVGTPADLVGDGRAVEELHDHIRHAVVAADLLDRAQVGTGNALCELCRAQEAGDGRRVGLVLRSQQLDGHVARLRRLGGLLSGRQEDDRGAAFTDLPQQPVRAEQCPGAWVFELLAIGGHGSGRESSGSWATGKPPARQALPAISCQRGCQVDKEQPHRTRLRERGTGRPLAA